MFLSIARTTKQIKQKLAGKGKAKIRRNNRGTKWGKGNDTTLPCIIQQAAGPRTTPMAQEGSSHCCFCSCQSSVHKHCVISSNSELLIIVRRIYFHNQSFCDVQWRYCWAEQEIDCLLSCCKSFSASFPPPNAPTSHGRLKKRSLKCGVQPCTKI